MRSIKKLLNEGENFMIRYPSMVESITNDRNLSPPFKSKLITIYEEFIKADIEIIKILSDKLFELGMEEIDKICFLENTLNDEEYGNKMHDVYSYMPDDRFFQHAKSDAITKRRVEKYCKENSVNEVDYRGPLPYRCFKISGRDGE